jgi:CSLREA domain-containing protein
MILCASIASADMTAPGDPIVAIRATAGQNSSLEARVFDVPSAEGPANAIDNDGNTKYLNKGRIGTGLIVTTQSAGQRVITGLRLTTAGDTPARDPVTITLEGTNAPNATTSLNSTWTLLYDGPTGLTTDPGRNRLGASVTIPNTTAYLSYRLLVTGVRGASDSMQFSELELTSTDSSAPGTVFTVTSLDDPGDGVVDPSGVSGGTTLREAIVAAGFTEADDEILFSNELSGILSLRSPLPPITTDMRINGSRAGVTISGGGQHRGLVVSANSLSLNRLTFTGFKGERGRDGYALSRMTSVAPTNGGAAAVSFSGGTMSITNCTFYDNLGGDGGDAASTVTQNGGRGGGTVQASAGTLQLTNCTFSGNTGGKGGAGRTVGRNPGNGGNGGGTVQTVGAAVTLNFCTIANNTGGTGGPRGSTSIGGVTLPGVNGNGSSGAGLMHYSGSLTFGNSIVANNSTGDVFGSLISNGYNLIKTTTGSSITGITTGNLTTVDPLLASLATNGGPVFTRALQNGSPAIDAADPSSSLFSDARLFGRGVGNRSDIGAYENGAVAVTNFPPQVGVNGGLALRPGDTKIIGADRLRASDPEGATVIYRLTTPPTNGNLRLNGALIGMNSEWLQPNINSNLLSYTANSGFSGDSFGLTLVDPGGAQTTTTFNILPSSNQPPALVTNAGLAIDFNSTVFIRGDRLAAVDPDNDALTYTLVTAPAQGFIRRDGSNLSAGDTFTQAQVDSGRVSYHSASGPTSFEFTVSDGFGGTAGGTFQITIAENQAPSLSVNNGLTANGGTTRLIRSTALAATDPNNDPLTFTLIQPPTRGSLLRNQVPLSANSTFTQLDINNDLITYSAGTEQGADSFEFTFSDGRGGDDSGVFSISIIEPAQSGPNYVVNSADDTDDGAATVAHCSLREAINAANNDGVFSTISFNIPGSAVHTITLQGSELPAITAPVTIDGYTQPGARPNSREIKQASDAVLKIEIDGNGTVVGLRVMASNTTVRGLSVGNSLLGVLLIGNNITGNTLAGNHIGLRADGITPFPNTIGISGTAFNSTIGGSTPADRNVIAGNSTSGISLSGGNPAQFSIVTGNYIGTKADGVTALANGIGLQINGLSYTTIGGGAGAENLISGNTTAGISIDGINARENVVKGNIIGTTRDRSAPLPNGTGIVLASSSNNVIGGTAPGDSNFISGNSGPGISLITTVITPPEGNRILGNSIGSNGGPGIDLDNDGVTPNDTGDTDSGPNYLQNFPVLTSVTTGIDTVITGTLNSRPSKSYTLQFYQNESTEPSGHSEGELYLGSTAVVTDLDGNATFTATLPGINLTGAYVTATATDPDGNTSEFSLAQGATQVGPNYQVTVNDDTDDGTLTLAHTSLREAIQAANTDGVDSTITITVDGTIRLASALPTLSNDGSLTLSGSAEGVTISGDADASGTNNPGDLPLFVVASGGNLTLELLTLSGGRNETGSGAAISNPGGTVEIIACALRNHFAGNGGAIFNTGSMTIRSSALENNSTTATGFGGAIWSSHTLAISNCLFFQNSAGVLGGAITSFNGLTITDSNFSTNHSDFNGGALRLDGSAVISGSTFSNNTAVNGGGAIMSHGQTEITNSTIAFNTALDGGGIQLFEGTATLRHLTIASNGATRLGGGMNVVFADATVIHSIISSNTAPDQNNLWGGPLNPASSNNLIDTPAGQLLLGDFSNHGGATITYSLLPGSPAIDAAAPVPGLDIDQRGFARSIGTAPDIGAFEQVPGIAAASPTISPAGGTHERSVVVSITNNAIGAKVRYTLDGSDPTETHGTLYTGPFTVAADLTVRAIAIHGGWLPSEIAAQGFNVISPLDTWRSLQGLAADGSDDLDNPSGDGVANLLKFAFNMAPNAGDLNSPNLGIVPSNGNAGLPKIERNAQGELVITFVRLKESSYPGITYQVETAADLDDFQPLDLSSASVVSIDADWERVTVTDPQLTPKRFGRVRVEAHP